MEKQGTEEKVGISDKDVRRVLEGKSALELVKFLLKGVKEKKAFRRKVLAWLIDTSADQLDYDAILDEIMTWIDEILEPWSGMTPRTPDLRELTAVKSAVKNHPGLAVPSYLAILKGIANFLDTFGGGPQSFYKSFVNSFSEASLHLSAIEDPKLQKNYFEWLESLSSKSDDFGYGVGFETQEILRQLRRSLYPEASESNPPFQARSRRRWPNPPR